MSASPDSATSLLILAPSAALPAEGDELQLAGAAGIGGLLRGYESIVAKSAPMFALTRDGVDWQGDAGLDSNLQLVDFQRGDDGLPQIDALPAMSQIDWAAVVQNVSEAIAAEHFIGTADEMARIFAQATRDAAIQSARGFAGIPLPLLSVAKNIQDGVVTIGFLGIWLSSPDMAGEMTRAGDGSCILLDGIEAEGRGLKEALMSAAMLAVVLQGSADAAESRPERSRGAGWFASLFSGNGSGRGEILKVTSQRLVQEPPRIHRDALDSPASARLVIDIGAQRAFLLKGGQIAFETPVSTGQGRTWTPRGTFIITEKVRQGKWSTIYHCPLPGWMRIGDTKVGMHEGVLPGYPASHGCIRMPIESAHFIFDHAPSGTVVQIVDSWTRPQQPVRGSLIAQR